MEQDGRKHRKRDLVSAFFHQRRKSKAGTFIDGSNNRILGDNSSQSTTEGNGSGEATASEAHAPGVGMQDLAVYDDRSSTDLWERALEEVSKDAASSDHLSYLIDAFQAFEVRDSQTLANKMNETLEACIKSAEQRSASLNSARRNTLDQLCKLISSTRDGSLQLAKFDPYHVAPVVLGGLYTMVQIVQNINHNDSEQHQRAANLLSEVIPTINFWAAVEKHEISQNLDNKLADSYDMLQKHLVQMYKKIVLLVGALIGYFKKSEKIFGRFSSTVVPEHGEWDKLKRHLEIREKICEKTRENINSLKSSYSRSREILLWLSSHDIYRSYRDVVRRAAIDERYKDSCKWFVNGADFKDWVALGQSRVLWLTGTIGTGKTTTTARAIQEVEKSLRSYGPRMAKFFFKINTDPSSRELSAEACLRSIIQQLSWNEARADIEPSTKQAYAEYKNMRSTETSMSVEDLTELLRQLVTNREAYIMIDGIDECEDRHELIKRLASVAKTTSGSTPTMHVLLSGRSDASALVQHHFRDALTVEIHDESSQTDQHIYITTEIQRMCQANGPLTSCQDECTKQHYARLELVLERRGQGLFRWIEIQLEKFSNPEYFKTHDMIDRTLNELDERSLDSSKAGLELWRAYDALFDRFPEHERALYRNRILMLLKLVAFSIKPWTFEELAEALSADQLANCDSAVVANMIGFSAEEVRNLLAGFVTEMRFDPAAKEMSLMQDGAIPPGGLYVRLAHASVYEYLSRVSSDSDDLCFKERDFGIARLCLSRIQSLHIASTLEVRSRHDLSSRTRLFGYACSMWTHHCKMAMEHSKDISALEWDTIASFCLCDGYEAWNEQGKVDRSPPPIGFFIAEHNFWPLLRIDRIRQHLVSVQDKQELGTLFQNMIEILDIDEITFKEFVHWFPEHIQITRALRKACPKTWHSAVESLLTEVDITPLKDGRFMLEIPFACWTASHRRRGQYVDDLTAILGRLLEADTRFDEHDKHCYAIMHQAVWLRDSAILHVVSKHVQKLNNGSPGIADNILGMWNKTHRGNSSGERFLPLPSSLTDLAIELLETIFSINGGVRHRLFCDLEFAEFEYLSTMAGRLYQGLRRKTFSGDIQAANHADAATEASETVWSIVKHIAKVIAQRPADCDLRASLLKELKAQLRWIASFRPTHTCLVEASEHLDLIPEAQLKNDIHILLESKEERTKNYSDYELLYLYARDFENIVRLTERLTSHCYWHAAREANQAWDVYRRQRSLTILHSFQAFVVNSLSWLWRCFPPNIRVGSRERTSEQATLLEEEEEEEEDSAEDNDYEA